MKLNLCLVLIGVLTFFCFAVEMDQLLAATRGVKVPKKKGKRAVVEIFVPQLISQALVVKEEAVAPLAVEEAKVVRRARKDEQRDVKRRRVEEVNKGGQD